jgi:hypothetical protein
VFGGGGWKEGTGSGALSSAERLAAFGGGADGRGAGETDATGAADVGGPFERARGGGTAGVAGVVAAGGEPVAPGVNLDGGKGDADGGAGDGEVVCLGWFLSLSLKYWTM